MDSAAWRDGLREGFMGTAYAVDLPVKTPEMLGLGDDPPKILVRVEVTDPRSTSPYRLEFSVPVTEAIEGGGS
ncbi:MAG: hypothetical protein GY728_05285 [Phycisphaeraceae bacterium]|nr:hypothetical protein [Phycisphaeraceae bacterium]